MSARARATRALPAWGRGLHRSLSAGVTVAILFLSTPAWCGWQTFGLADGLPAAPARVIAHDGSGNLWFSTGTNPVTYLSRYDGVAFRQITLADGLIHDDVRAILPDREGRIWFGTQGGVSVLDSTGWRSYRTADGLVNDDVRGIFQDRAGHIWFATAGGASRFDGTTWTTYRTSDGLAHNSLMCVFEDRAGAMWFGTEASGLSRFDGTSWTTYTSVSTSGVLDNAIRCITQTRDGLLWVGTRFGGLSRFDGVAWLSITNAGSIVLQDVTALREDRSGLLWASSDAGLARFDGRSWRSYGVADGFIATYLHTLTIDDHGNIWVGTDNGATRYDAENWTGFTGALFTEPLRSLVEDDAGMVWAASGGNGALRYDRATWTAVNVASTGGGLASDNLVSVLQDSSGAMWFGTSASGVSRLQGATWQTFTTAEGVAGNNIGALARDSSGTVWVGTTAGLSRFDGTTWTSYTNANGLPGNRVRSLTVARDGSLWCGTSAGAAHFKNGAWTSYTTADGLVGNNVYAVLEDQTGALWFGTTVGLSRFDNATWRSYTPADGLAAEAVSSLAETPDSVLWIGTNNGVSRFDGEVWRTYVNADGLPDNIVHAALVERSGDLWFGTASGAGLHEPARVPPQTVITVPPPVLSANRLQTIPFVAAYRQTQGIEFSTALDTGEWSSWSSEAVWVGRDLLDGVHTFRVRARNLLHFVDPTPATAVFEVAATPPIPILSVPAFREPARDTLSIRGTANALRFRSLKLEMRPTGVPHWDPPQTRVLAESNLPVIDGVIARLATRDLPDGDYDLRLNVQDSLGLSGYAQVTFVIDNVEPFAAQTTPAQVSALSGGDVFTTNREAHVYIPPRGLPQDAIVSITPLAESAVPAVLPDGATLVDPGVSIAMTDLQNSQAIPLQKTAILDRSMSIETISFPAGMRLAFYSAAADDVWHRIGGTLDEATDRFSTTFTTPGKYAIYAAPEDATLSSPMQLSLTPRVLSSRSVAATTVRIAFVMARAGSARVTVHNKAGRLMKVVMDGQPLAPGTNLVSWDGRDNDAKDVPPGLYFVTVEALGDRNTQTVGVVR